MGSANIHKTNGQGQNAGEGPVGKKTPQLTERRGGSQCVYARAVSISPEENSEDGVLIAASDNLGKEVTISSNRKRCRFRFKGAIQIQRGKTLGSEK